MNNAMQMDEMLESMGCKRWIRGDKERVYIPVSVCCELIGLSVTRYGSGNVQRATLEGEHISNGTATSMLAALEGCYYDVVSEKFYSCHGVAPAAKLRFDAQSTEPK